MLLSSESNVWQASLCFWHTMLCDSHGDFKTGPYFVKQACSVYKPLVTHIRHAIQKLPPLSGSLCAQAGSLIVHECSEVAHEWNIPLPYLPSCSMWAWSPSLRSPNLAHTASVHYLTYSLNPTPSHSSKITFNSLCCCTVLTFPGMKAGSGIWRREWETWRLQLLLPFHHGISE